MKKLSAIIAPAAIAALLFQSPSFAQSFTPADSSAVVSPTVHMISGGVGEEMDYLKSVEHQYNLKLLFTEANGVYLAEVPVRIQDKNGDVVLDTVTNGPVLLVTLPPGNYKLTATQEGASREQKISINGKSLHSYQVRFPAVDEAESGGHSGD